MRSGFAACLALASMAASAGAQSAPSGIAETIVAQERAWSEALIRHDVDAVARLIGDDYIGIDGRGVVTSKADEVAEAAAVAAPATGPVVVREALTEVRVRAYGETAVLTAINTQYAVSNGTESAISRFRRTTVWFLRDGRWQCVSFHGTRLPAPPRGAAF